MICLLFNEPSINCLVWVMKVSCVLLEIETVYTVNRFLLAMYSTLKKDLECLSAKNFLIIPMRQTWDVN